MLNKRIILLKGLLWLLLLIAVPSWGFSQTPAIGESKRVVSLKLDSKLMKRDMPYRVILPVGYDDSDKTRVYPTIYLLHGLTGHFNDWSDQSKLIDHSAAYKYVLVMPEGDNGWYSDSEKAADDQYESYIIKELIPEIEKKFRSGRTREGRAIAGLSMGGYGSLKFGLKYPGYFVLAGSFSGALNAADLQVKDLGNWKALVDSIDRTYGAAASRTRKENDLFAILRGQSNEQIKTLPFIYLDCGTEDFLIGTNRSFADILLQKKIPHEFRQLPGQHNWQFWDSQIQEFLKLSKRFVK